MPGKPYGGRRAALWAIAAGAGWAGATPGFWRWSAQTPPGRASGRSRPPCATQEQVEHVDIVVGIEVGNDGSANINNDTLVADRDDILGDRTRIRTELLSKRRLNTTATLSSSTLGVCSLLT